MEKRVLVVAVLILIVLLFIAIKITKKSNPETFNDTIEKEDLDKFNDFMVFTGKKAPNISQISTINQYFKKFYPGIEPEFNYGIYNVFYPLESVDLSEWFQVGSAGQDFIFYQQAEDIENNIAALNAGSPGQFNPYGFTYLVWSKSRSNFDYNYFMINTLAPLTTGASLYFPLLDRDLKISIEE